jgi:hypothetical protein
MAAGFGTQSCEARRAKRDRIPDNHLSAPWAPDSTNRAILVKTARILTIPFSNPSRILTSMNNP